LTRKSLAGFNPRNDTQIAHGDGSEKLQVQQLLIMCLPRNAAIVVFCTLGPKLAVIASKSAVCSKRFARNMSQSSVGPDERRDFHGTLHAARRLFNTTLGLSCRLPLQKNGISATCLFCSCSRPQKPVA
jgi:hypothetical protein